LRCPAFATSRRDHARLPPHGMARKPGRIRPIPGPGLALSGSP
jgi:hypothetical protein